MDVLHDFVTVISHNADQLIIEVFGMARGVPYTLDVGLDGQLLHQLRKIDATIGFVRIYVLPEQSDFSHSAINKFFNIVE